MNDPLERYRDRFVGADSHLVYFDGNSLGRPLKVTAQRLASFVTDAWGGRLIRGWDEHWFDLPLTLGDEIGRVCLGAAPGQVAVGDSTTVLLYKLMRAAVAARPGRTEIVIDRDNFPTDRYVADGVARECGLDAPLDRCRPGGRHDGRAAGRGRLRAHCARGRQPRRLPVGLPGRRRGADPDRARRRRADLVGPLPLRRVGAGRARRVGGRPGGRLHLQVPQRRPGLPGLLLRRRAPPRQPHPADPGLDGRPGPVPDGAGLHADAGDPPLPVGDARRRRHARGRRHGRAHRRGRHGRGPREVGGAHRARDRARRRAPRRPRGHGRLAARRPPARRARHARATRRCARWSRRCGSAT